MIRVFRLVRILRLIRELHTIVVSIFAAFRAFAYVVFLLALLIYVFSVLLTQIIADSPEKRQLIRSSDDLNERFGSVGRTAMSLYDAVSGGADWGDIRNGLGRLSGLASAILCLYQAFVTLVILNIVTGVFVDAATSRSQEDKAIELLNTLVAVFCDYGEVGTVITQAQFEAKLQNPLMIDYFEAINVDPADGRYIFDLLALSGNGRVQAEDFVSGCLSLEGPAKALDLAVLMREQMLTREEIDCRIRAIERGVSDIAHVLKRNPIV